MIHDEPKVRDIDQRGFIIGRKFVYGIWLGGGCDVSGKYKDISWRGHTAAGVGDR